MSHRKYPRQLEVVFNGMKKSQNYFNYPNHCYQPLTTPLKALTPTLNSCIGPILML